MKISLNEQYVTRSGRPVRIYAVDGSSPYPVHGAIQCPDGWASHIWTPEGKALEGRLLSTQPLPADLVPKPAGVPQSKFRWAKLAPPWMQWLAKDGSGRWYMFEKKPTFRTVTQMWIASYGLMTEVHRKYRPDWKGDPKDSLTRRPEE